MIYNGLLFPLQLISKYFQFIFDGRLFWLLAMNIDFNFMNFSLTFIFLNFIFYGWEFSIWRCILYHVLFFFEAWLAFEAYYICLLPETACNRFIVESYVCPEKLREGEEFWLAHEFRTTASWIRRMSLPWPALHIAMWLWQRWRHFLYNGGRNINYLLYFLFNVLILDIQNNTFINSILLNI